MSLSQLVTGQCPEAGEVLTPGESQRISHLVEHSVQVYLEDAAWACNACMGGGIPRSSLQLMRASRHKKDGNELDGAPREVRLRRRSLYQGTEVSWTLCTLAAKEASWVRMSNMMSSM